MAEVKNDERGASGEARHKRSVIDYSRSVGWWCPVCGREQPVSTMEAGAGWRLHCGEAIYEIDPCRGGMIPVYLPIPAVGQRQITGATE